MSTLFAIRQEHRSAAGPRKRSKTCSKFVCSFLPESSVKLIRVKLRQAHPFPNMTHPLTLDAFLLECVKVKGVVRMGGVSLDRFICVKHYSIAPTNQQRTPPKKISPASPQCSSPQTALRSSSSSSQSTALHSGMRLAPAPIQTRFSAILLVNSPLEKPLPTPNTFPLLSLLQFHASTYLQC